MLIEALLPEVAEAAKKAGKAILRCFDQGELEIQKKTDETPLTRADLLSHDLISTALSALSDWPVLSEEGDIPPLSVRKTWSTYWLIDPLDGTRGFINGVDEFTVNIALIQNQRPILGVLFEPAYGRLYYAAKDQGAFLVENNSAPKRLHTATTDFVALRFVVGKYHRLTRIQTVLDQLPRATLQRLNSSMKFSLIARGEADVYARFGPISEWDIAAGEIILEESGGKLVDFAGESLQYNARNSLLCPPMLAVGQPETIYPLIHLFTEGEKNA